jgi:hypothetical protein
VSSKFLIGAGAWLLGAASATGGSLYAVSQLVPRTHQYPVAVVNAELAQDSAPRHTEGPSPSPSPSPKVSHSAAPRRSVKSHQAVSPVTYQNGVLTSDGGSVGASCGPHGARFLYESPNPAQFFEIDLRRLVIGPSATASVTFINSSRGVTMNVTCNSAGVPGATVSDFPRSGPHHDE